jgi:hypothetical protein
VISKEKKMISTNRIDKFRKLITDLENLKQERRISIYLKTYRECDIHIYAKIIKCFYLVFDINYNTSLHDETTIYNFVRDNDTFFDFLILFASEIAESDDYQNFLKYQRLFNIDPKTFNPPTFETLFYEIHQDQNYLDMTNKCPQNYILNVFLRYIKVIRQELQSCYKKYDHPTSMPILTTTNIVERERPKHKEEKQEKEKEKEKEKEDVDININKNNTNIIQEKIKLNNQKNNIIITKIKEIYRVNFIKILFYEIFCLLMILLMTLSLTLNLMMFYPDFYYTFYFKMVDVIKSKFMLVK